MMSIACICGGIVEGIVIASVLGLGGGGLCLHRKKSKKVKKECDPDKDKVTRDGKD